MSHTELPTPIVTDKFSEVPETLFGLKKRLLFVTEALEMQGNDPSVLDIGCGTGEFLTLPLARQGWRITGVDIHPASVAKATELAAPFPQARFICGTLNDIAGKFDVVVLSEVIEHVQDPRKLLEGIRLRLSDAGVLVLTLPNGYGPFEIDQVFSKRNFLWIRSLHGWYVRRGGNKDRAVATHNQESPHINFFSWKAVHNLIDTSGFCVLAFRARTFIAGDYLSALIHALRLLHIPTDWLTSWNAAVADRLPPRLVSGWMFTCRPK